jgi:hypothetical protein
VTDRKHLPHIRLHPQTYERWLKEKPKQVPGGPIILIRNQDSSDDDDVYFEIYHMESDELPEHYARDLIIMGYYNEFEGFKIWITVENFDYLLMAHQKHNGPFTASDGLKYVDHPHFHEIDFYSPLKKGKPDKRWVVIPKLYKGINSAELLNTFIDHYYIEDGRIGNVELPAIQKTKQRGLNEFNK